MRGFLDFAGCRRGSIPIMTALLLLPIIVISGGAIDLVAHERMRTKLQDGLDRGVLAAASLTQTVPTRETLDSFLLTAIDGPYDLTFTEETRTNRRIVEADLEAEIETAFLGLIGIDSLAAHVHSKAEERRSNIEISLILDISGSMRFNASGAYAGLGNPMRIDHLRPAAKGFLDVVLSEEAKDYTTVNLVPYAGQVSVGPVIYDSVLNGARTHRKSSCLDLRAADFTLGMPNFAGRAQTMHFTQANHHDRLNANEQRSTEPWWCPDDPHAAVLPGEADWVRNEAADTDISSVALLSNDREAMKARIDGLKLYDGTGTPIALKWGLLMLDPALQPKLAQARTTPTVASALAIEPKFNDRPAPFDDEGTLKFMVLMTDGVISSQVSPKDKTSPIQYYNNTSMNGETINASNAAKHAAALCKAARDNGVTVFTIGFDVNDTAAQQMRDCASPGFFYRVNALNIADAFNSIATAIQQIKLVG